MIEVLASALGLALVAFVMTDVFRTTLMMHRGGPITNWIGNGAWRALRSLQRAFPNARILPKAGVVILLITMAAWVLLSWTGWLLVFVAHANAVLDATTMQPAGFWSRVYYVGFALITLGTGDYAPHGAWFQVLSVLAAIQGFFLITLSITYLVPIISAVVGMRQLATQILAIGRTPSEMLIASWSGGNPQVLMDHLQGVRGSVALLGQQHYAYPVLRYFPTGSRNTEIAVALPVLDEALTLLLYGVRDEGGMGTRLHPLRATIANYLGLINATSLEDAPEAPAPPDLEALRRAGIPTVSDEEFRAGVLGLDVRRRLLRAHLQEKRRSWGDVLHSDPEEGFYG